jgi:cyanophycinase
VSHNGVPQGEIIQVDWRVPGYLMVIGGADRLDPRGAIAKLFLQHVALTEANSSQRDIVMVSSATRHPTVLTDDYRRIFERLGVERTKVHTPLIRNHDEANRDDIATLLGSAAGIFITGGDQYLLTQVLDRTSAEKAIRHAYLQGAIVAGTSAGATAMGRPMIVAGGGTGELRLGVVQMSRGLGWVGEDTIIDTHFGARGRFPRLTSAVAEHPEALGIGVDENTCLLVDADKHCTIEGTGVAYFVDGSHVQLNSAHKTRPGHALSIGSLAVTALSAGGKYDLINRRVILEKAERVRV